MNVLADVRDSRNVPKFGETTNVLSVDSNSIEVLSRTDDDTIHARFEYLYTKCVDNDIDMIVVEDKGIADKLKEEGIEVFLVVGKD